MFGVQRQWELSNHFENENFAQRIRENQVFDKQEEKNIHITNSTVSSLFPKYVSKIN